MHTGSHNLWKNVVLFLGFLMVLCPPRFSFSSSAPRSGHNLDIPRETVSGRIDAQNGYSWRYGYSVELKEGLLLVDVDVNLIPMGSVSGFDVERVRPGWEACVEQVWSRQFALETSHGHSYPIIIDMRFTVSSPFHKVLVRPGGGGDDALNWKIWSDPELIAHEFGHLLGVYDEYKSGGTDPEGAKEDKTSIMTLNPTPQCRTYARHYLRFRDWFVARTGMRDVAIKPMPPLRNMSRRALK
jgi:hypothetical protein